MPTQGPTSPASATNYNPFGRVVWVSPSNAISSDNSRSSATISAGDLSAEWESAGIGFGLASDAILTGFTLEIEGYASNATNTIIVRLRSESGGSTKGSKEIENIFPTSEAITTLGSDGDMWDPGSSFSDFSIAEVNAGVLVCITFYNSAGTTETAYLDHVRLSVHYTLPSIPGKSRMQQYLVR